MVSQGEVIFRVKKMTSAQVVETSVTNNSSFQNYPHPDDHTIRTTDTPGFKPLTILIIISFFLSREHSTLRRFELLLSELANNMN